MPKILIVDDTMFMRGTIKMYLERNGFEVCGEAVNGEDAVRLFKTLAPDIVTMDITMPDKNGIDALREIMTHDKNAKVIMVSAMGQEAFVTEALSIGAKGFIVKPFKEETLLRALVKFSEQA